MTGSGGTGQSLLASVLVATAVGLLAFLLVSALATRSLRQRPPRAERRAMALRRLLGHVRTLAPRAVGLAGRRDLSITLARAGLADAVRPRDVAAARVLCVALAVLAIPRMMGAFPPRMLPLALACLLVGAAELPLIWLRGRARSRGEALLHSLPDALDLLRACLAAGLPLRRALMLASEHSAEPIAGEFACVAAETVFGIDQATALDGLAARNPLREIRSLVAAMHQAERHGSPLAPVIAAQAADSRRALNRTIVERGAKAGPKIQLVVSTTIVPGAMIGMGAAVVAAMARGDLHFL